MKGLLDLRSLRIAIALIVVGCVLALAGAFAGFFVAHSSSDAAGAPAPPVRAMAVASMDPRGDYILHSRLVVPACGGYTDRIEVRSGRKEDIPAAFHRWLARNQPLASQCVRVYVYGDSTSYEAAAKNPSAAELQGAQNEGLYENDPGIQEVWILSGSGGPKQTFWKPEIGN